CHSYGRFTPSSTQKPELESPMIRGVIFDHDGTLIDTERQHYQVWNQILQEFGHHLPEDIYNRDYNGVPTIGTAARLVERFQLDMTPEQLAIDKGKRVLQRDKIPPLMPGVRE